MVQAFPTLWETIPEALGKPEPCYNLAKTKQCLPPNFTKFNETGQLRLAKFVNGVSTNLYAHV